MMFLYSYLHHSFCLTFWFLVSLVHLQFGQQTNKPLKALLVTVYPDEVNLIKIYKRSKMI